jgi:hypothetical protein
MKQMPSDVEDRTTGFLEILTKLSAKYGVAIAGEPVLFLMEPEDYESRYSTDGESRLTFG